MKIYSDTNDRLEALISVTSREFEAILLAVNLAVEKAENRQLVQAKELKRLQSGLKKARLSWVKENNLAYLAEEWASKHKK